MDVEEKLSILAGAAKYDASCGSGPTRGSRQGKAGSSASGLRNPIGVCLTGDGRCIRLFKVLYSNVCRFDCAYCVHRVSADTKRASFTTDELIGLTCALYRGKYAEGLFLSSGIFADPDIVMERLIATAKKLRTEAGYGGYIHLKLIPGVGQALIREAGRWADRLSANIELPTDQSLQTLAPQKSGRVIFQAMQDVLHLGAQYTEDRKRIKATPAFAPAGQSTQLIVGATSEDDRQVLALAASLYRRFGLRRVYYSAYIPVGVPGRAGIPDPRLPDIPGPPFIREHRLYQADWLLRFYHFRTEEILDPATPYLDTQLDPKTAWAIRHLGLFPLDLSSADYEALLRVPGIGAAAGRRIIEARRSRSLSFESLRGLGVILKRARYFITLKGAFLDRPENPQRLRSLLSDPEGPTLQAPLFDA
ncbi:MAG: putative DNA modification/repair radical SAM protein [Treponema sp.]|jgi:putative DNA modification/repair radical SAM protein|nr:putative DNA modification/repair radical SAM protein [Treponema sp.]